MRVLAKEKKHNSIIDKAYGIHDLMEETCLSAKNGIKSALYESMTENVKKLIKEEFNIILENVKSQYLENDVSNCEEAPLNNINNSNNEFIFLNSGYYNDGFGDLFYDGNRDCFFENGERILMKEGEKQRLKKQSLNQLMYNYMDEGNRNANAFTCSDLIQKNRYLASKNIKFSLTKFSLFFVNTIILGAIYIFNIFSLKLFINSE